MHIVATARAPTHMKNYLLKLKTGCPRKTSDCDAGGHEICTFFTKKKILLWYSGMTTVYKFLDVKLSEYSRICINLI